MEELLAWDSVWTSDLIALMVRVAEEIEVTRDERQRSAIVSVFSKEGAQHFASWASGIRERVEADQLAARGQVRECKAGEILLEAFGVAG